MFCLKYDISLPLDVMYDLVVDVRERCTNVALWTVGYGHIGDGISVSVSAGTVYTVPISPGNLHLNVVGEGHSTELRDLLEPFVFDWTGQKHTHPIQVCVL